MAPALCSELPSMELALGRVVPWQILVAALSGPLWCFQQATCPSARPSPYHPTPADPSRQSSNGGLPESAIQAQHLGSETFSEPYHPLRFLHPDIPSLLPSEMPDQYCGSKALPTQSHFLPTQPSQATPPSESLKHLNPAFELTQICS